MVGKWLLKLMDAGLIYFHCMYLSIVRYYLTAIPSGVAKISSFHEESLSDPNPQTADIKSGIRAENLGLELSMKGPTSDTTVNHNAKMR